MRGQFRSDMIRKIYQEAVGQGWLPERGNNHAYLCCPFDGCHYREAFSLSGRGRSPETGRKVSFMRRHGFVWKGRGGDHTADPLGTEKGTATTE